MALLLDRLNDPTHKYRHPYGREVHAKWHRQKFNEAVEQVPKFLLTNEVMETVKQLGEACPVPYLGDGYRPKWVEYSTGKGKYFGVLIGDDASGMVFVEDGGMVGDFVVKVKYSPVLTFSVQPPAHMQGDRQSKEKIALLYAWVLRAMTLLDQPKIVDSTPSAPVDERLQRSRIKSGKRPLADYHVVTIHVSKQERAARLEAEAHFERTGVRLHKVRSFVRVKNGKLERVKEHWRGDASLGTVKVDHYKVKL